MKILIIFDRNFLTDRIVVITSRLPMRPTKMNTKASIAPTNVTCLVGCRRNGSVNTVELSFIDMFASD
jgi:hypothetical protein